MYIADKRYFLTADNRVVEESDPAALRLLVGVGGSLPIAEARKYGLVADEQEQPAEAEAPADKAVAAAPETKAVQQAPANKAVKGPEANK
jgi:hypothetical protein